MPSAQWQLVLFEHFILQGCICAHLSWVTVSLCLLSSASLSPFLLWALAASCLTRVTVSFMGFASEMGGVEVLGSVGFVQLGAEPAGEEEVETEAVLVIFSACFLIFWMRDLRATMSSLRRAWQRKRVMTCWWIYDCKDNHLDNISIVVNQSLVQSQTWKKWIQQQAMSKYRSLIS